MKNQKGYINFDATRFVIFLCIISGLVGWALIELVLWIFSHIDISWI